MKAEELMIGDWIENRSGQQTASKAKEFEQVERVNHFSVNTNHAESICENDIRPVQITTEILEKNGFQKVEYLTDYSEYVSEDGTIIFNNHSNSEDKEWFCHIDNDNMETIGSSDIQYVHELQHLLKLCGVDKEIEL